MKKVYETPQIEVIEVAVEQGFAVSDIDYPNPFGGDERPW